MNYLLNNLLTWAIAWQQTHAIIEPPINKLIKLNLWYGLANKQNKFDSIVMHAPGDYQV